MAAPGPCRAAAARCAAWGGSARPRGPAGPRPPSGCPRQRRSSAPGERRARGGAQGPRGPCCRRAPPLSRLAPFPSAAPRPTPPRGPKPRPPPRSPPMSTSKKARGLRGLPGRALGDGCDMSGCPRCLTPARPPARSAHGRRCGPGREGPRRGAKGTRGPALRGLQGWGSWGTAGIWGFALGLSLYVTAGIVKAA